MSYQYQDFGADKQGFFATVRTAEEARDRAKSHQYGFYANNKKLILDEFNLLFEQLKADGNNRQNFWLYCYYCCLMLQLFHEGHGDTDQAEKYEKLKEEIEKACVSGALSSDPVKQENFIAYLGRTIGEGLRDLLRTATSLTSIKNEISIANLSRIYWFFCRMTIAKSLLLARDMKILDQITKVFGKKIDVDRIVKLFEKPKPVMNVLSVAFLAARFIINAGMLLKHTFLPSEDEKKLNIKQRFYNEMYTRHTEFLNDIVWSLVNLVTNYNRLFHLSDFTAGWLLAGFLFFDFMLIIWQLYLAEQEYLTKLAQLTRDHQEYERMSREAPTPEEREGAAKHCQLLLEEMKLLEIKWQAKRAAFIFVAVAALAIMAGFSASMIFSSPMIIIACYAICMFAMAMYLSNDSFANFREKQLKLRQARIENKNIVQAKDEYIKARNDFIFTMIQNAVIPTLVITTFAVYWPAALVLAAAYAGYKVWGAYSEHSENQKMAPKQGEHDEDQEEHDHNTEAVNVGAAPS